MPTNYSVQFVGYVIQDEFTEYHMKVTGSDNVSWLVRRRYKEFRELHDHLKLKYPDRMPAIPGKKLWGNQDPEFVRQRQDQLQVYMNGVLALEPDCRTRVLQRFLEIKKVTSDGSPVLGQSVQPLSVTGASPSVSAQRSISELPVPAPSVAAQSSPMTKQKQTEELNKAVETLRSEIFDLSATPSLLDAREYETRFNKYQGIVARAHLANAREPALVPPSGTDLLSQFAQAAFVAGAKAPEYSRSALSAILGKGPIATESELVAFFSLKPETA